MLIAHSVCQRCRRCEKGAWRETHTATQRDAQMWAGHQAHRRRAFSPPRDRPATMAIRVLLDHDVPQQNIILLTLLASRQGAPRHLRRATCVAPLCSRLALYCFACVAPLLPPRPSPAESPPAAVHTLRRGGDCVRLSQNHHSDWGPGRRCQQRLSHSPGLWQLWSVRGTRTMDDGATLARAPLERRTTQLPHGHPLM